MYDYVIVGAGSAGCVLANRLSEDPDVNVLLLEAGGPDTNDLVHLPAAFSALYRTAQDWDHSTIYEPFVNDRRIYLPRGKVLGGSSSINAMIYIRGNPIDYDEWGPGWTWDEMLPYFKLSEDNERGEDEYHGVGGPLPVSEGRSRNPLAQAFLDSAAAHGLPANEDFNGAEQDGVGWYQVTHRNGARASAAVAYLHPVMDRPNLTVETHVHALSLLFEGERAVGVVGMRLSEMLVHRAEREVIVCGGAYNSPQLLMLSGLGRPAELEELQIEVVARGARGRAEPARPPERRRGLLDRRGDLAVRRAERGEPGAVRGGGARPAHLERGRGGRVHAHERRARGARHPGPLRPGALPVGGARAGRRARVRARRVRAQAEEPRVRGTRLTRSHRQAADHAQLHGAPGRRGLDGRRRAHLPRDLRDRTRSASSRRGC